MFFEYPASSLGIIVYYGQETEHDGIELKACIVKRFTAVILFVLQRAEVLSLSITYALVYYEASIIVCIY